MNFRSGNLPKRGLVNAKLAMLLVVFAIAGTGAALSTMITVRSYAMHSAPQKAQNLTLRPTNSMRSL